MNDNIVKKVCKELDELYKKMQREKKANANELELLKEKALKVYYLAKALQ